MNEEPIIQQITCGRCNSMKHQLIGIGVLTDKIQLTTLCESCGVVAALTLEPNKPIKKESKAEARSYTG